MKWKTSQILERFFSSFSVTDGCWEWKGPKTPEGYGIMYCGSFAGKSRSTGAYRFSWEVHTKKQIPAGLHIDHLCFNKSCVNPNHLEPVTPRVNSQRGQVRRKAFWKDNKCQRGHSLLDGNIQNNVEKRRCRLCRNWRRRLYWAKEALEIRAKRAKETQQP